MPTTLGTGASGHRITSRELLVAFCVITLGRRAASPVTDETRFGRR